LSDRASRYSQIRTRGPIPAVHEARPMLLDGSLFPRMRNRRGS